MDNYYIYLPGEISLNFSSSSFNSGKDSFRSENKFWQALDRSEEIFNEWIGSSFDEEIAKLAKRE